MGVSREAVRKAIPRIRQAVVYINGVPKIADPALARHLWAQNTDLSRAPDRVKLQAALRATKTGGATLVRLKPDAPRGGQLGVAAGGFEPQCGAFQDAPLSVPRARGRHSRTGLDSTGHPASRPPDPSIPAPGEYLEPQPHGGALRRLMPAEDGEPASALAGASAREKHWRAETAQLKYLLLAGKAMDTDAALAEWTDRITTARTRILGVPSTYKQRHPELTIEQLETLDALLRETLEGLAPPNINTQETTTHEREHRTNLRDVRRGDGGGRGPAPSSDGSGVGDPQAVATGQGGGARAEDAERPAHQAPGDADARTTERHGGVEPTT